MFTVKFYKIKQTTDELGYNCVDCFLTHFVMCKQFERVNHECGGATITTFEDDVDASGVERHVKIKTKISFDAYLVQDAGGRTIDRLS